MTLTEKRLRQKDSIVAWLRRFIAPEQVTELRALHFPSGAKAKSFFFSGTNLEAMAEKAIDLEVMGPKGIYFTPNPLRPELIRSRRAANDDDVQERRWLLVDIDPVRAADLPANDAERQAAWSVMQAVWDTLDGAGLKGGIVGDSGNGFHLCYPINWPNDEASKNSIKLLLRGLHARCSTAYGKVDTSTFNASRIWRLYGTKSAKGVSTQERPHRNSYIIDAPCAV
jgi:hypothetical protein